MVQFIRLRGPGDFWVGVRVLLQRSQLLALREAARMVPNCAQPIILAYGTCASAKISRHSAGAWLYAHCAKINLNLKLELEINVDYCA